MWAESNSPHTKRKFGYKGLKEDMQVRKRLKNFIALIFFFYIDRVFFILFNFRSRYNPFFPFIFHQMHNQIMFPFT